MIRTYVARILLVVLLACLLDVPAVAETDVENPQLEVLAFSVFDPGIEDSAEQPEVYSWKDCEEIVWQVEVHVSGFAEKQKLNLFAALKDAAGDVWRKQKERYWLGNGTHTLHLGTLLEPAELFDYHDFVVELEADIKHLEPLKFHRPLAVEGPPRPQVKLRSFSVVDEHGHWTNSFEPGEEIGIELELEIKENHSALEPEIVLYCEMEEDASFSGPNLMDISGDGDHHGVLEGEAGMTGQWLIAATATLPEHFTDYNDKRHDFDVYILVRFGSHEMAIDRIGATIRDYRPGKHRRAAYKSQRLIQLSSPRYWSVRMETGWH